MAKGIGLIGNFKGKVGNTVGYKISASNTGNTQGIRVYQPIVRNPKTSAQAEQRAKLAPNNATYRALKMVIDRGNEGLPYGNKSRLAWLKQAFKAKNMPWFVKGATIDFPVGGPLTKGSLPSLGAAYGSNVISFNCSGVTPETDVTTIGKLSTAILAGCPTLREGDQLTFVAIVAGYTTLVPQIVSIVLDKTSAEANKVLTTVAGSIHFEPIDAVSAFAVIVSREGANGEHLRSTEMLKVPDDVVAAAPYDANSKAAAIESYQNAAGANSDWAEESIQ